MNKIDLIGCFVRMIYRVLEKITSNNVFFKSYYEFISSANLSSILVRIFGFGIQVPNSPNNNSVINITGLQILDNQIN